MTMQNDDGIKKAVEKLRRRGRSPLKDSAPNKLAEGADAIGKAAKGTAVAAVKKLKGLF